MPPRTVTGAVRQCAAVMTKRAPSFSMTKPRPPPTRNMDRECPGDSFITLHRSAALLAATELARGGWPGWNLTARTEAPPERSRMNIKRCRAALGAMPHIGGHLFSGRFGIAVEAEPFGRNPAKQWM